MDELSPIKALLIFAVFVVLNAILYGFSAAIRSINDADLEAREKEGSNRAKRIIRIKDKPDRFIATVHVISMSMAVVIGYLQFNIYASRFNDWLADVVGKYITHDFRTLIAYLVVILYLVFVMLALGVVLPKRMGARYNKAFSYGLINIVRFIMFILTPFTALISLLANLILRIFGIDPNSDNENVTEEDIMSMVNEGHEQGVLLASEAEMITNIFELDDKSVEDVMLHRTSVVAIDGEWNLKQTIRYVVEQNYSRFPVYIDDFDNVIGIIHMKDLMVYDNAAKYGNTQIRNIKGLIRKTDFVPETKKINSLFKEMQQKKMHMVIVVDEYGQNSGIVAMEDILEEIVGNIFDEHDEEIKDSIVEQKDGTFIVNGMTTLEEIEEKIGINYEEEEYDTLNGYLISKLDRIPADGEQPEVVENNICYQIIKVDNKTISKVRITVNEIDEETEQEE